MDASLDNESIPQQEVAPQIDTITVEEDDMPTPELSPSVAACRIQARVRGFAVRLMLRRIAGNDDDSDATIPFDVDDEDLLQRRSLVAEPDVDQADNDDDSEVTRCESVGLCSFDHLPLDDNRYYDTDDLWDNCLGLQWCL